MSQKQIRIGRIGKTEIVVHSSLILALILTMLLLVEWVIPSLIPDTSGWLTVSYAILLTTALVIMTVGFELGRFYHARANNREVMKLVLLPLSSLLAVEKKTTSPRFALKNSILSAIPLFGLAAVFALLSLLPAADAVKNGLMLFLSGATLGFAILKQLGLFALDRTSILHGFIWKVTGSASNADKSLWVWHHSTMFALVITALLVPFSFGVLGSLLCLTIAWGMFDAIYVRRAYRSLRKSRSVCAVGAQEL